MIHEIPRSGSGRWVRTLIEYSYPMPIQLSISGIQKTLGLTGVIDDAMALITP